MMQTIAAQLQQARQQLAPVAQENAALEARLLAGHAWRMTAEELVFYGDQVRDAACYAALVARRMKAEPVAQIVGEKHFWRDAFYVTRDVLTPRADSETMIEALLRLRPDHAAAYQLLDLGTGSGCLLLSALREYSQAVGVGVDRSPAALAVAQRNAAALGLPDRVAFLCSDWCSNIEGDFDIVLANPPYIPTAEIEGLMSDVREHEPHAALDGGVDGLDCYRALARQLSAHTKPGALVLFEVGAGQAAEVAALGKAAGWELKLIAKDLAGIERIVAFETC